MTAPAPQSVGIFAVFGKKIHSWDVTSIVPLAIIVRTGLHKEKLTLDEQIKKLKGNGTLEKIIKRYR